MANIIALENFPQKINLVDLTNTGIETPEKNKNKSRIKIKFTVTSCYFALIK